MKTIPKTGPLTSTVTAPPSKSYSVRALLLAAMADGTTTITNCLDADDTRYAFEALKAIGFDAGGSFQRELYVGPRKSMSANEVPIFVGNAGTAMRFFTGWLAFTPGRFLLHGEHRMHERPICRSTSRRRAIRRCAFAARRCAAVSRSRSPRRPRANSSPR